MRHYAGLTLKALVPRASFLRLRAKALQLWRSQFPCCQPLNCWQLVCSGASVFRPALPFLLQFSEKISEFNQYQLRQGLTAMPHRWTLKELV